MKTTIDWNSSEISNMFVDKNDGDIARALGVSRQRVHQVRKKFGIASVSSRRRDSILKSGLLGNRSDAEIGILFGEESRYVAAIRHGFKIKPVKSSKFDQYVHLMGKIPDNKIAVMAQSSQSAISNYRRRKNIEPFRKRVYVHVDWDNQPLGKESDEDLATKLGCSVLSVARARTKRNIPIFGMIR